MASGPEQRGPTGYYVLFGPVGFIFLFFMISLLCIFCKKRKKRRMQNISPSRAPIVDVSLLRQTQLRSLSKSDTKLHEIKRPYSRSLQLRPVSMDPDWMWQRTPGTPPNNATYSNLPYTSKAQLLLHESVALRTELGHSEGPASTKSLSDEYACVRKLKKGGNTPSIPPAPDQCPMNRPDDLRFDRLQIEDMYSKVNKKKRSEDERNKTTEDNQGVNAKSSEHVSAQGVLVMQPEENLYESICEMSSHGPETCNAQLVITEL